MDEGLKWGKVVGVLFFRPDPEINFHSSWIGFPSRQSPLNRIANLMGLGIAGSLHHHEMGIVVLVEHYDAHFMVMERSRDPKTHEVRYPVKRTLPGGETDPAGMEIDLWVRSKEQNTNNFPPFETFVHLCWDEVTWK